MIMGFHIVKRDNCPLWKRAVFYISAVLIALALGAVVLLAIGVNPFEYYAQMFTLGTVGNPIAYKTIMNYLKELVPLAVTSIALSLAFKMRFWNIGAEGQVLIGGVATAACMIYLGGKVPTPVLFLAMVAASVLSGAVWGLIPAIFKAKWNTNETLFTLMMNYVAIQITSYCVALWENPFGSNSVGIIHPQTEWGWFPKIFGQQYMLNVIIVLGLTAAMYVYLKYTK